MRNLDLEAAIIADPEDDQLYRVYADWLEEQGDPRAELIRVHLDAGYAAARELIGKRGQELLGPVAELALALSWKRGFVNWANLSERNPGINAGRCVKALFAHPVSAFLESLEVFTHEPAAVIDALPEAPPTMRHLRFFSPTETATLTGVRHVLERLHKLVLDGKFELVDPLDLPLANEVAIEIDALSETSARIVANADMPLVQGLTLGLRHCDDTRAKLAPLFARELPRLDYLTITDAEDLDDLCELVAAARFAPQLKDLEIDGMLTDYGVEALRDSKRLTKLTRISVKADIDGDLLATLERPGLKLERFDPFAE